MKTTCFLFLLLSCCYHLSAQGDQGTYNPHDLFVQPFSPPAGNEYRSADGTPGPSYWQNAASYLIHAALDTRDTTITGAVTIHYVNNSPDALRYLWLQLDENIFSSDSRAVADTPYPGDAFAVLHKRNGGFQISDVLVTYAGNSYPVQPIISDTRMQIRLNAPLQPRGDSIEVTMHFGFVIPHDGAGRFGILDTKNGPIYQIGQWYPRMCVYDDVEGWNTLPYLGQGEFYCDYGNYDYSITAPADMIIYGSGELQNPQQVLTPEEIKRLAAAANSDKAVPIIRADEVGMAASRPANTGNLTWHFTMTNTRDVGWAASKACIWDAARVNLPSGRKIMAMSCYPVEAAGDSAWSRSTEYLKASIELYSQNFFEYPWNVAISSAGITGGMEYPGIIFNDAKERTSRLWFLIAHEIGHNWFPMLVGSNERRYMWQDEGLNTYINYYITDLFNHGEYVHSRAYLDKAFFASRDLQFMDYRDPLMTPSDAMDPGQHYQFYGKTAYGLNLLRTVVVGKDRFDYAFRKYIEAWAYKHPTPYDLFRCINNGVGEDLNWFWKEWFFTTWKLDQGVADVEYVNNDPAKGSLITITNNQKMIMPVIVSISEHNGKTQRVTLPVEIWQRGDHWTFPVSTTSAVDRVVLDPDGVLPDTNRANNTWNAAKPK